MFKTTMHRSLSAAVLMSLLVSTPVFAQNNPNAEQIIQSVLNRKENVGFKGRRTLKVYRQSGDNKAITASAKIEYKNKDNYRLQLYNSQTIGGIEFNMQDGVNSAFFPDEKLYLFNGSQSTSYMPERIILSRFNPRMDLLKKNYTLQRLPDDTVELNPTYVLQMIPKHTYTLDDKQYWVAPRRKYWVDKDSGYILREERFWDMSSGAYAVSAYELFSKDANLTPTPLPERQGVRKVDLSGKGKNSFLSYSSVAQAESQEGIKVNAPSYLPKGFEFKEVQIFTLFGARIQVLNYTDGLNDLMITVRPQQNAFVTLLAGAASINLIKKISDLSTQAPNNYFSHNQGKHVVVAFGDVAPFELEKVAKSIQE